MSDFTLQQIYNIPDDEYDELTFLISYKQCEIQKLTGELGAYTGRKIRIAQLQLDIELLEKSYNLRADQFKDNEISFDLIDKIRKTLEKKREKLKGLI